MKTILIATDFSVGSDNARVYGLEIAKKLGCSIRYIHAYSPPVLDPNIPVGLIEETYAETVNILEAKLNDFVAEDKSTGIESDYLISYSDINSMVEDASENREIELILVGKTGHTGFLDKVIGSTAVHLISHMKAPLLIIPEEFKGDIFEKVCYASELEYDEETFIEKALDWSRLSKNQLVIGHIFEKYEMDLHPNSQFVHSINEKFKKYGVRILEKAGKNFHSGIVEMITEEKVSILVLTTHKRGFLDGLLNPSKTKGIVSDTKIPVLVLSFD